MKTEIKTLKNINPKTLFGLNFLVPGPLRKKKTLFQFKKGGRGTKLEGEVGGFFSASLIPGDISQNAQKADDSHQYS